MKIKSDKVAPELAELSFHGGKVFFKRLAALGALFRNGLRSSFPLLFPIARLMLFLLAICAHIGDMIELNDGDKLRLGATEFQWNVLGSEAKSEVSEQSKKEPSQAPPPPSSPGRVTRSSQGKATPKKEDPPIAPTQIESEERAQGSVMAKKPVQSQEDKRPKAEKDNPNSQSKGDLVKPSPRQKRPSQESGEQAADVRLTRRLSKEPSVMIVEKDSTPPPKPRLPLTRALSNLLGSEKESDSEKESQSAAKAEKRSSLKRKREEDEEELRTVERNRHVKTRRLTPAKDEERIFEVLLILFACSFLKAK